MSTIIGQDIVKSTEQSRLSSLYELNILDTPSHPAFDRITKLCSSLFEVPIAAVSFVDEYRIWSKSIVGSDSNEIERVDGMCSSAIRENRVYLITNTLKDERTVNHPLVAPPDGIRFYVGIPLKSPDGILVGTLCLLDYKPRKFSSKKINTLKELAGVVESEIALHISKQKISELYDQLKKSTNFLHESEERWSFAIEGSELGVWDLNVKTNKIYLSNKCKQMLGYSDEQISADMNEWIKLIHPSDLPCLVAARASALKGDSKGFENEHRKLDSSGNWKWVQVRGSVVERDENGEPVRVVGTYTDISERKKIEANIIKLAHFDTITGLPNRSLFFDRLDQQLKNSQRSNTSFGVLIVDLDHFKEVNDIFGHQKGDQLLELVARRLQDCLRSNDTVARLGGDEFAIIVADINAATDVEQIAQKIIKTIDLPFDLEGDFATVTASIGIAIFPKDSTSCLDLIKKADIEMYNSKKLGRNRYSINSI